MAQLQASASDADTQLYVIGAYIDELVPTFTEQPDGPASLGGNTAPGPAEPAVDAVESYGADGVETADAASRDPEHQSSGSNDQLQRALITRP